MSELTPKRRLADAMEAAMQATQDVAEDERNARAEAGRLRHINEQIGIHLKGVNEGRMDALAVVHFLLKEYFTA